MPEELCVLWERELGAVFEQGELRRFEFEYEGVGGARCLESDVVPERNAAGEVQSVVSFTCDRTDARRAEAGPPAISSRRTFFRMTRHQRCRTPLPGAAARARGVSP